MELEVHLWEKKLDGLEVEGRRIYRPKEGEEGIDWSWPAKLC